MCSLTASAVIISSFSLDNPLHPTNDITRTEVRPIKKVAAETDEPPGHADAPPNADQTPSISDEENSVSRDGSAPTKNSVSRDVSTLTENSEASCRQSN